MLLDLREFERFPATKTLIAEPGEYPPFREGVIRVDGVRISLQIQQSGTEYFCSGEVCGEVMMECARCLIEFPATLVGDADFVIRTDQVPASEKAADDDGDYVYTQGSDLRADVSDQARQALVLAVALKPLCREDCRGLCPTCGTNLNEHSCSCSRPRSDGRWDALRQLFPQ